MCIYQILPLPNTEACSVKVRRVANICGRMSWSENDRAALQVESFSLQ